MNRHSDRISVFDDSNLSNAHKRNEIKRKRNGIIFGIISGVLILAALIAIGAAFCRVTTVEISGSEMYTENEILEAANIEYGMQLISINRNESSDSIKQKLNGIENVKISYSLPNKIKIQLYEGIPYYSFENNGKFYYLSENFVALGSTLSVTDENKIYRLDGVQIAKYVAGKKVEFYDDDWYYIIKELISALEQSGLSEKLTVIETGDKFNISLRYDGRIHIMLGEFVDITEKLDFAKSTIDTLEPTQKGTIRIKNYKFGSFLKDEY